MRDKVLKMFSRQISIRKIRLTQFLHINQFYMKS